MNSTTFVTKKTLAVALAACLSCGASLAATVSVTDGTVPVAGGTTTPSPLNVQIVGDGVTAGYQCNINYDTAAFDVVVTAGAGDCNNNDALGRIIVASTTSDLSPYPNTATTTCSFTATLAAGIASDGQVFTFDVNTCLFSDGAAAPAPGPHTEDDGLITAQSAPVPLTLSFSPPPGTTINVTAAMNDIVVTASGGSGTATLTGCGFTGGNAGSFTGPASLTFNMASSQNIMLGCTQTASAQSSTFSCNETDGDSTNVPRMFPVTCPAGTVTAPTITSTPPAGGTLNTGAGFAGQTTTATIDFAASGGALGGTATINCTDNAGGPTFSVNPAAQTVAIGNQPTDVVVGCTLTTAPQSGTISCAITDGGGTRNDTFTVNCPAGSAIPLPPPQADLVPSGSPLFNTLLVALLGLVGLGAVAAVRRS